MTKYEPREHVIDAELANGNMDAWRQALGFPRQCTCHPDDNPPVPCPGKYALTDCRAAAVASHARGAPDA